MEIHLPCSSKCRSTTVAAVNGLSLDLRFSSFGGKGARFGFEGGCLDVTGF